MTKPILRILLFDDGEDDYVTFRNLLSDCQEFSDHLSQIFTQGFTTKQNGHEVRLFSSALVAQAMEGTLTVPRTGDNKGATFTLEFSMKPVEVSLS